MVIQDRERDQQGRDHVAQEGWELPACVREALCGGASRRIVVGAGSETRTRGSRRRSRTATPSLGRLEAV